MADLISYIWPYFHDVSGENYDKLFNYANLSKCVNDGYIG